ncbi:hypothetical protein IWT140_01849 [Secundilactobacillus pentosiphilus]|uniref:Uncharacterized protein n=1 Tax=Secundilactobacillus pentosiphilus TaxID=1714682 RepID=A0A1Z5IS12_9LACO|nr:hypothetical protein IWT140_01849 [Secundilactobacillus pentosiphilus]
MKSLEKPVPQTQILSFKPKIRPVPANAVGTGLIFGLNSEITAFFQKLFNISRLKVVVGSS